MKAVEAILLLILAGGLAFAFLHVLVLKPMASRAARKRRLKQEHDAPWVIEKHKTGQGTQVQLEKPGEEPYLIGNPVSINLPQWEYDEKLTELLLEADGKAYSLNRRLPR